MPASYLPKVSQRPAVTQREFRGVNKLDPFSIGDAFATDANNTSTLEYPVLTTRSGYSVLGSVIRVLGLGVWKESELSAVFADGSWRKWNGSAFISVATGLNASADWSFANFKGGFPGIYLLAANGTDPVKQYDGATLSNLSGAPAGLKYIEQYADRVWGVIGNTLRASGYRLATDWTSTMPPDAIDDSVSFNTEIESPDGETICALKAGLGRLVIFKPSAIYELLGYSPSDYRVDPVSSDIGTINNQCVAVLQSGMYFLDNKGIYLYRGDGVAPQKGFSKPVQWYIDNMNQSAKQTCAVGTDGRLLYVSIPMNSSTQPDTLLVYDPEEKLWSVHTGHSTVHFANQGANTYLGDYNGSVRRLGGSTDAGNAITSRWVSRPFTAPSLSQKLRWIRLWLTLTLPVGSSISVYLSPSASGDSDWVQTGATVTGNGSIQRRAIYFPSTIIPPTEQIRIKIEGTGPYTIHEISRDQVVMPLR